MSGYECCLDPKKPSDDSNGDNYLFSTTGILTFFTGLIALRTIALSESMDCSPKLIASNLPFTELASNNDLLRCDML